MSFKDLPKNPVQAAGDAPKTDTPKTDKPKTDHEPKPQAAPARKS